MHEQQGWHLPGTHASAATLRPALPWSPFDAGIAERSYAPPISTAPTTPAGRSAASIAAKCAPESSPSSTNRPGSIPSRSALQRMNAERSAQVRERVLEPREAAGAIVHREPVVAAAGEHLEDLADVRDPAASGPASAVDHDDGRRGARRSAGRKRRERARHRRECHRASPLRCNCRGGCGPGRQGTVARRQRRPA